MADDDYMSDAFLAKTVRPGLVFSRITARKYDMQRKKIESDTETRKSPSLRAKEEERRNEGLSTEIGEGNKGFALLKKMGYLEGCGLGRDGQGRTEPVPVEVKNNRQGVGTVRRPKHKLTLRAVSTVSAAKQARVETEERRDFRQRMSDKFALVGTLQDLAKSQRVCYQLDQAKGLSCVQSWFWPPECRPGADSDNEDEDDDQPDDFKLQLVTKHLRSTHFYCVWCGSGYKDTEEMISLCPGDTARDHDD